MMFAPETLDVETWPAIYAVLAPALARSGETVTEVIDELLTNTAQLWVMRKGGDPYAVGVSRLEETPKGRMVRAWLLAGPRMEDWIGDLILTVARKASDVGAVGFRLEGRPGWGPALRKRGFKTQAVVMEKLFPPELAHG
jgi:hypothetical protein